MPVSKENKKTTHGGARKGAGNKPKYKEPSVTIAIRVPASHKLRLVKIVKKELEKLKIKRNP